MLLQVISTTDNQYLGMRFEVEELSVEAAKTASNGLFNFLGFKYKTPSIVEFYNANYIVILHIHEE